MVLSVKWCRSVKWCQAPIKYWGLAPFYVAPFYEYWGLAPFYVAPFYEYWGLAPFLCIGAWHHFYVLGPGTIFKNQPGTEPG